MSGCVVSDIQIRDIQIRREVVISDTTRMQFEAQRSKCALARTQSAH
jgi:hypothetical protein